VLILPPGHAQAINTRRRLRSGERWMVRGVLGALAVLVVVVVVSLATAGHSTGNGCVNINIPSSLGSQNFYKCGARARSLCAAVGTPGGLGGVAGRAAAAECRKVSLPVGRS
jgi:hypothetical protein